MTPGEKQGKKLQGPGEKAAKKSPESGVARPDFL